MSQNLTKINLIVSSKFRFANTLFAYILAIDRLWLFDLISAIEDLSAQQKKIVFLCVSETVSVGKADRAISSASLFVCVPLAHFERFYEIFKKLPENCPIPNRKIPCLEC